MTRVLPSLVTFSLLVGCVAQKPLGVNQACPCAAGWSCDTSRAVCIPAPTGAGGATGAAGVTGAGGTTGAAGTTGAGGTIGAAGTTGVADAGVAGAEDDDTPPVAPGCAASCGTPAGIVEPVTKVDDVYTVMQGRWEFCDDSWSSYGAPDDAIGVDYGPASRTPTASGSTVGGKMYYLVAGPTGPVRGNGFAYQLDYDVSPEGATYQLNMHPAPNSGYYATIRYSPCPTELEVELMYLGHPASLARFAPGDGILGADAGTRPQPTPAVDASAVDASVDGAPIPL